MCGIAGIILTNASAGSAGESLRDEAARMGASLAHRGPDGHWTWLAQNNRAALSYRRLAIVDPTHCLFTPFVWNERFVVLYNGEIYNYRELRDGLVAKGYAFSSASDAEVLPALYHCYGTDCLRMIDGMFSFAMWDIEREELFCARDRFGEKPFFYSLRNGRFRFASEIKALRTDDHGLNENMLFRYLCYNLVENPDNIGETFYNGVERLAPASWMKVQANGSVVSETYWTLEANNVQSDISVERACGEFTALLGKSVARRLQADTEVGCTVSGGLDSASVLALMRHENKNGLLKSFTARVREKRLDEGPFVATLLE
ncbi:MAG TPA: asparagine synthetase B, partial [Chitinophagales bacterium]|nr:asparagine synthetase B [Chitinophagales bacterium]